MEGVRPEALCCPDCFLGRALPSLEHPPARGLTTLWTPAFCRLRRIILIFLYYIAETDMNEDTLWNIFAVTGSVEDYLRYSALRDKKNDNGRGNRS